MALADTSALISSLELKDKFTATANAFDKRITGLERTTTGFGKTTSKIGNDIAKGVGKAVHNIELLGVAIGGLLVSQVKFGIDSLEELDKVTTQTAAVLKSTQDVSGQTAQSIRDLANKYEDLNAVIDDKVIQSGENLLLTFTHINKQAFEPALLAALNLNQALGGGPEGLQGTIIQVGKALEDPVKGLTNLRRVGVSFTADEQKQVKTLIAHNKLYEAQKIILGELTKQFGGSFAAAGKTSIGTFAHLSDAIDDAQQALATALLPTLDDTASKLDSFIRGHTGDIKKFGQDLADAFKGAVSWVQKLDWKAIGDAFHSAADGAKGIVDAFLSAPSWLQEAVVTGWGLNKLTGGAVTSIFGDLAKGIAGQFLGRGTSPANPLWVQSATGGVGGPGGPAGVPTGIVTPAIGAGIFIDQAQLAQFNAEVTAKVNARKAQWANDSNGGIPLGGIANSFVRTIGDTRSESSSITRAANDSSKAALAWDTQSEKTGIRLGAAAAKLAEAGGLIAKNFLTRVGGTAGVAARSKLKFSKDPTDAQADATFQRDLIHKAQVIARSSETSQQKLADIKALAAAGNSSTSAKLAAIEAKVGKTSVTVNVSTSTTISAGAVSKSQKYKSKWGFYAS